jgi:signal recognition particle subunit SRP54
MFEGLTGRLGDIFTKLRGRGALNEEDVVAALREVRIALLEADVALPVVKDFIAKVRERAVGQEVLRSITPGQQVIKIVHDCLVEMLGEANETLNLTAVPPVPILMVGLQGSGKTTTTGKIAKRLVERERKRVLMASLDVHRPGRRNSYACSANRPTSRPCRSFRAKIRSRSPNVPCVSRGPKATTSSCSTQPAGWRSTKC